MRLVQITVIAILSLGLMSCAEKDDNYFWLLAMAKGGDSAAEATAEPDDGEKTGGFGTDGGSEESASSGSEESASSGSEESASSGSEESASSGSEESASSGSEESASSGSGESASSGSEESASSGSGESASSGSEESASSGSEESASSGSGESASSGSGESASSGSGESASSGSGESAGSGSEESASSGSEESATPVISQVTIKLNDNKNSTYSIELIGVEGSTWTYRVSHVEGRDLSHWNVGLDESCRAAVTGGTAGYEVGRDGSTGFWGIKWDSEGGVFSFTLDGEYPSGDVQVLAKAGTKNNTGTITGPVCNGYSPLAAYLGAMGKNNRNLALGIGAFALLALGGLYGYSRIRS